MRLSDFVEVASGIYSFNKDLARTEQGVLVMHPWFGDPNQKQTKQTDKGYLADGFTIEKICKNNSYTFINQILGIHM